MIQLESRLKLGGVFFYKFRGIPGSPNSGTRNFLKYGNAMGSLWAFPGKISTNSALLTLVIFVSVNLHQAMRYFDPTTEPDGAEYYISLGFFPGHIVI